MTWLSTNVEWTLVASREQLRMPKMTCGIEWTLVASREHLRIRQMTGGVEWTLVASREHLRMGQMTGGVEWTLVASREHWRPRTADDGLCCGCVTIYSPRRCAVAVNGCVTRDKLRDPWCLGCDDTSVTNSRPPLKYTPTTEHTTMAKQSNETLHVLYVWIWTICF